jgi:hypothetical protein
MPLARVFPRICAAAFCVALAACTTMALPPAEGSALEPAPAPEMQPEFQTNSATARVPRELFGTFAEMVIQRVEPEVSREEIYQAVQSLVAESTACLPVPSVWLSAPPRAGAFVVRYDLMERDWGEDVARNARGRMDELVASGFLTQEDRPEIGAGAVRYDTTREGRDYMRGTIDSGQRPAFCAPAGRRLVEITSLEWGQYPCGTLRVRFTHVADDWPVWARHEATRARLAQSWPAHGEPGLGEVSLSRQWFAAGRLPRGVTNGALISACMDDQRQRVVGDDLTLAVAP